MAKGYERTRVKSLRVRNFRSIRELVLDDLPSIIVLHGDNGVGKSNVLKATHLAMRWAAQAFGAGTREEAQILDATQLAEQLGIRPDEITTGAVEMRIGITLAFGDRARRIVAVPEVELESLEFDCVLQDVGGGGYRFWFDRALVNGVDMRVVPPNEGSALVQIAAVRNSIANARAAIERLRQHRANQKGADQVASADSQIAVYEKTLRDGKASLLGAEQTLRGFGAGALLRDRLGRQLLPNSMLLSTEAYRQIRSEPLNTDSAQELTKVDPQHIQRQLFEWSTSIDASRRQRVDALAKRLQRAGLGGGAPITLRPVQDRTFREYRTLLGRGDGTEVALDALGSGEQQLFVMVAELVLAGQPIVQIEEPEAHLHHKTMERLARELLSMVDPPEAIEPEIDQLWIATHHHRFALAERYFDVTWTPTTGTQITQQERAKAASHFYEPGPLWEVFRTLAQTALSREAVVLWDSAGKPVTAAQLDEAIRTEDPIAREWAARLTEYMVLAMKKSDANAHRKASGESR